MHILHTHRAGAPPGVRAGLVRAGAATAAVVAFGALSLAFATSASAHDQLLKTSPADGASVAAPTKVVLTFGEKVLDVPKANQIAVTGSTGEVAGTLTVKGATVTKTFPQPLSAGTYRVQWRVASDDGHPVSGTFRFAVTGEGSQSPDDGPAATAPASSTAGAGSATSGSTPASTPTPTSTPTLADDASSAGGDSAGWGVPLTIALVIAALVAAGLIALARRRGSGGST